MTRQHNAQPKMSRADQILGFLQGFVAQVGYSPSVREIQQALDVSSSSVVHYNLRLLRDHGHISFQDGAARTIRVLRSAATPAARGVPFPAGLLLDERTQALTHPEYRLWVRLLELGRHSVNPGVVAWADFRESVGEHDIGTLTAADLLAVYIEHGLVALHGEEAQIRILGFGGHE